jgi:hypothetical protein
VKSTSASFGNKHIPTYDLRFRPRHPAQEQIVREARRFNVLACGRRFGKTTLGLDVLITEPGGALDGQPVAWFAPNSKLFNEVWLASHRPTPPHHPPRRLPAKPH